jgi:hypothetical protein
MEDEIMDIDRKPAVDLGHLRQLSDVVDIGNALDGSFSPLDRRADLRRDADVPVKVNLLRRRKHDRFGGNE